MNKYTLLALSVSGGILSGLAWTDWCPGFVLFVSFVPFLLVENHLFENQRKYSSASFFTYLLPGFVIFSIMTFGWVRAVSIPAAICVILMASLLMSFTLWLAHIIRLKAGTISGSVSFIAFWLTLELLCLNMDVLSPWANLGNGLSKDILFIQWYEVTGVAGGTLWILVSNLFLTSSMLSLFKKRKTMFPVIWLIIVIIPSGASLIRYGSIKPSVGRESEVVIVQPDYDPYTEKFTIPFKEQLEKAIEMAGESVTINTDWLVLPETIVDDPVNENNLAEDKYIRILKGLINRHPGLNVVAGMETYKPYQPLPESATPESVNGNLNPAFTHYFNSAINIDSGPSIQIYHKSKLVPGFETGFTSGPLRLVKKLLPEPGGNRWGYEPQKERSCFTDDIQSQKIAPVICYESIYGEYVTDYIKEGAEAIFVITNDGWWKNTNGYKQHFAHSSMRAIETRRPLVRSANTGISGIIDIRGRVIQKSDWWTPTVLKGVFSPETRITVYVRYGDYLMYMAAVVTILIILMVFVYLPFRDRLR